MNSRYRVLGILGELLALDRLLDHVDQVDRVSRHLLEIVVEGLREHLEGEACADAAHALVDAGGLSILLDRFCLGIGVAQVLAVVDPHLRMKR